MLLYFRQRPGSEGIDYFGQICQEFPGQHAADTLAGGPHVCNQAMEKDSQTGSVKRIHLLGQETADHAGENVPGAPLGQGRIAGGVDHDSALGVGDNGLGPFEHHDGLGPFGQFQGGIQAVGLNILGKASPGAGTFRRGGASG